MRENHRRKESKASLTIDDRELKSGIYPHLSILEKFSISISRMMAGDYCIDQSLWIERKTMTDFLASITDGRLFKQCQQLKRCQGPICLILEGEYHEV